jgi:hypothetical protein
VKAVKADVIAELKRQQENETTSTLLLIDVESCEMDSPDECPDLLLTVVSLLQQNLITDVVPIGLLYIFCLGGGNAIHIEIIDVFIIYI